MDKISSKYVFKGLNLPVINFFKFDKQEYCFQSKQLLERAIKFGFPLILKPSRLGSSIGISLVKNKEEFLKKAKQALEFDDHILVEKAILDDMKEYNVACVLKNEKIVVSDIDKPIRSHEILTFDDKYVGSGTCFKNLQIKNRSPKTQGAFNSSKINKPKLPEKLETKIKNIALKVYKELELQGPVRVDFILDKKSRVYLNEVNTVPGSLAYYFFVGSTFKTMGEYINEILNTAINVFDKKVKVKNEYITKLI